MIAARRLQRSFADGFITGEVDDLWEPWMRHADQALEDDALLSLIQNELAKRCKEEQDPWAPGNAGRRHPAHDAAETCPRLEL